MAFAKSAKRGLALLGSAAMMVGFAAPTFAAEVQTADAGTKTVYVQVDRRVFGASDPELIGPVKVTNVPSDAKIIDILKVASNYDAAPTDAKPIQYSASTWGTYISAFRDTATPAFDQAAYKAANGYTNAIFDATMIYPSLSDNYLAGSEYSAVSGWMFSVNEATTYGANQYYNADTTAANIPDNGVIHFEYSINMGADIGMNAVDLPTIIKEGDYGPEYDWVNGLEHFNNGTKFYSLTGIRAAANNEETGSTIAWPSAN